jgi:hypothetical protein
MPLARPAAIEKILYHMANVENLLPREGAQRRGTEIMRAAERAGQQRLPLYSEKFMKDFDRITGAMNEGKLSDVAENLVSPEAYRNITSENPEVKGMSFFAHPEPGYDSGIALPERNVLDSGAPAIVHEGRHFEQYMKKFGSESPIFSFNPEQSNALWAKTDPLELSRSKNLGSIDRFSGVHQTLNEGEFDAAMSEMGTMIKAGDINQSTQYMYERTNPRFAERTRKDYKLLWDVLPPKAQKHFIETAALGGVALPTLGSFQPETKNK